jgi:hypothetical protein
LTTNREKLRQSALLRASTNTIRIVSVHQRKRFVLARSILLAFYFVGVLCCAARRVAVGLDAPLQTSKYHVFKKKRNPWRTLLRHISVQIQFQFQVQFKT